MGEVHIIGQITEAKEFPRDELFCKWYLNIGNNWRVVEGKKEGQTQVASSQFTEVCNWSYPIDIHLATASIQGWPKIYLEVYHLDWLGRAHLFGYGLVTVPTSPGRHTLDCYTWRPLGSFKDRFVQYFLGGGSQIKYPDLIFSPEKRYRLSTEAMGVVTFDLDLIMRNFSNYAAVWVTIKSVIMGILPLVPLMLITVMILSNRYVYAHTSEKPDTEKTGKNTTTVPKDTKEVTTTTMEPLNVTISTCESNDTECTNVITTTVHPVKNANETNNVTAISETKKGFRKYTVPANASICTCNLQVDYCDINCCCDPDCAPNDKLIFGYCKMDDNRYYDSRYCNYDKYMYVNNTPVEWKVKQKGLFCIVSSNLPQFYLVQNEEPIEIFGKQPKISKPFWAEQQEDSSPIQTWFGAKNYVFGDSIIIVLNDSSIDNFRIPRSFLTKSCITDHIYYLKDVKSSCSRKITELDVEKLNFDSYFQHFKVVGSPALVNTTKLKNNIYKNCLQNICLKVKPKICDLHFSTCSDLNTSLNFECTYDLKKNLNTCLHAVTKIHYKIYHNGSHGLHSVEVLGVFSNFSYQFGRENFEVVQEFAVDFLWIHQSKNYSQIYSGNPGYIPGKSILVGVKISNKNTSFIQRISPSFIDNFLVLPSNINGKCCRNDTYNLPVEFNYNLIATCELNSKFIVKNANDTATEICRNIQQNIFDFWGIIKEDNRSLVVGLFGNANASMLQDWTSILYETTPSDFLRYIQGNFTNKNETLLCQNVSTHLNIDIFYSRIDLKTVLNQQKVLGVVFGYQNINNHSFAVNKIKNISVLNLSFSLVSRVSFYDITGDKARKYVDSPSFNLRLPYDFFYPFIRVGNGENLVMPNIKNIVVISLFLYLLNCAF